MPAGRSKQSDAQGLGTAPSQVALDRVMPRVYRELKRLAHRHLASEHTGHTLSTTALVHETYLRLAEQRTLTLDERSQFFVQAARAMRRILVDYARRHRALRRGGGHVPRSLEAVAQDGGTILSSIPGGELAVEERAGELIALDEALVRLARLDGRLARVVECRFYAGLTEKETADVLGVTARTVARDWVKARAWLRNALADGHGDGD